MCEVICISNLSKNGAYLGNSGIQCLRDHNQEYIFLGGWWVTELGTREVDQTSIYKLKGL